MSSEQNITQNIQAINPNFDKLKQAFPHCFDKNGDFDFTKFKTELSSSDINLAKEGYSLDWLGKSYARILASDAATTLIKEDESHNLKPENINSQNLLIKGDNLEVLKHLSNAYYEKVKMIYIDPPYNTGSDGFVYNDDRKFTSKQLQDLAGVSEDEAKRILEFTQSNSNSHSAWLTFMYPRLYIAKQLVKDDGVIFVSIDDNEVAQLRLLMDEVFGEENLIAEIPVIMNLKGNQDSFGFAETHEYFLVYAKEISKTKINKFDINEEVLLADWKEDEYGLYKVADNLRATGENAPRLKRPNLWYPIFLNEDSLEFYVTENDIPLDNTHTIIYPINPEGDELSWYWGKTTFNEKQHNLILTKTKNGWQFYRKQRPEIGDLPTKKPKSFFYKAEYSTSTATTHLKELFGKKIFKGPKPVPFIKDLIILGAGKDDIILDFFGGSGTTAHSVMHLNQEDQGNRKFILVQLPELLDAKKSKVAYDFVKDELCIDPPTIFEITKERITRAAKQTGGTSGFKIYETTPIWENYDFKAAQLANAGKLFEDNTLTEEDVKALFTTWKTYDGSSLTEQVETVDLAGYTAFYTTQKLYLMQKGFTTESLKALLEKIDADANFNPTAIIAFGYYFESKALREIAENIKTFNNKKNIDIDFVTRY